MNRPAEVVDPPTMMDPTMMDPTMMDPTMMDPEVTMEPAEMVSTELGNVVITSSVERGLLTVPFDEGAEDGETIELTFIRVRAGAESDAEPMLVHFGGPGSSAVSFMVRFVTSLPSELRERYVFIGLDDIGVGGSPEIACPFSFAVEDDPDVPFDFAPTLELLHPFLEASEEERERFGETYADACATTRFFDKAGTPRYARDINRLREALGYERLNILGFSYGTSVALHYAALFPDRVGRMVLDSPLDPRRDFFELSTLQAEAFLASFDRLVDECTTPGTPCNMQANDIRNDRITDNPELPTFSLDAVKLNRVIDNLATELSEENLDRANTLSSQFGDLRLELNFPPLAEILGLIADIPEQIDQIDSEDGGGGGVSTEDFISTLCNDAGNYSVADVVDAQAAFEADYMGTLSMMVTANRSLFSYVCPFWGGSADQVDWGTMLPALENVESILVISSTGDTQTPRALTEGLVEAIPELSVVSVDEVSHSVSLSNVNPCLEGAVVEFFNEGTVSVTECGKSERPPPAMDESTEGVAAATVDGVRPGDDPLPWEMLLGRRR